MMSAIIPDIAPIAPANVMCLANIKLIQADAPIAEIAVKVGDSGVVSVSLRPCPHDTFPNWARSIAPSSRPVARVHTGATGTLVPDPRDHLSTWNEWARSIAIGCALSNLSCGRSSGRYRPVSKSAAVGTRLLDLLLPLLGTRALSRVFNRLRHVKADTRTLISKVLQSSKPYSHTNKINK